MSFNTITQCANDGPFRNRLTAGYAKEGRASPITSMNTMIWVIASDPSIEAPYASAIAAGNPNPGGDESAITDGNITAAIQAHASEEPPIP